MCRGSSDGRGHTNGRGRTPPRSRVRSTPPDGSTSLAAWSPSPRTGRRPRCHETNGLFVTRAPIGAPREGGPKRKLRALVFVRRRSSPVDGHTDTFVEITRGTRVPVMSVKTGADPAGGHNVRTCLGKLRHLVALRRGIGRLSKSLSASPARRREVVVERVDLVRREQLPVPTATGALLPLLASLPLLRVAVRVLAPVTRWRQRRVRRVLPELRLQQSDSLLELRGRRVPLHDARVPLRDGRVSFRDGGLQRGEPPLQVRHAPGRSSPGFDRSGLDHKITVATPVNAYTSRTLLPAKSDGGIL